jgi:hypothetical protein
MRIRRWVVVLVALFGMASRAGAEEVGQVGAPPPERPAPYVLPWQLRAVGPASVVRLDDSLAISQVGTSDVLFLSAGYKLFSSLGLLARAGGVGNWPEQGATGYSVTNPSLGLVYGLSLPEGVRLGAYLNTTLPVGTGGGNTPNVTQAAANTAGIWTRSALDNSMFAVNDWVVIPGLDVAWVAHGLTLQGEATLFQLTRVRGELVQKDANRTNFTSGLFAGYFLLPQLSVGLEGRYQRWLSTPVAVAKNSALRETLTFAGGLRGHFEVAHGYWLRPGISYARGVNGQLSAHEYNLVQFDLPFYF